MSLVNAIKKAKSNVEKKTFQEKLFGHMVSFRNRQHNHKEKTQKVSEHLNVEVSSDQHDLLNPSVLDTITGFIIKDSKGDGVKKRIAQRRLNMIDATVSSHCAVLNSAERMHLIKQANEVAAVLADIELEQIQKREKSRKEKAQKEAQKKERKLAKIAKEKENEEKARVVNAQTIADIKEKGVEHIKKLTVSILKDLLVYYFKSDAHKEKGIRKPQLIQIATRLFIENNGREVVREVGEQNHIEIASDQEMNTSESSSEDEMSVMVAVEVQ